MQLQDRCVITVLKALDKGLKTKKSISFNDVMASPDCKQLSVSEIGKALELLRRNGMVKASSRFGCSELLEFTATEITDQGKKLLGGKTTKE